MCCRTHGFFPGEVFGEAVGWLDFGVFGGSYGPFVCIPLFDDQIGVVQLS